MGAEGWNTMARNRSSSSFGPFSTSHGVAGICKATGFRARFSFAPLIQEMSVPENSSGQQTAEQTEKGSSTLRGSLEDSKDYDEICDHIWSRDCTRSAFSNLRTGLPKGN